MVVAFVLVTAALVVYGSTVYTQQLWSKEYRKLKHLQRSERQMVSATALTQGELAQQAQRPGSGLVPKTSTNMLFLQPSPPRPTQVLPPVVPPAQPTQTKPVAY